MAEEWARIPGKDGFNQPDTMLVEPQDDGALVLISAPPAGLRLDWHGLDLLIERLGEMRRGMPGGRPGRDA